MAISIPWLTKRKTGCGRIGVAVGPDGVALAYVGADGLLVENHFFVDPNASQQQMADLVESNQWQNIPCTIVLHPSYYQLLLADAPSVEGDEMSAAVRWKIKDLLDYPVEDAAIEHFLLPVDAYRGRQQKIYAAALRRSTLQGLVEPVEAAGLAVDCIEVAEIAIHNVVSRLPREGGGIALVQLYEHEGFINLVEDGALYLSRRLDIGLERLLMAGDDSEPFDTLYLEIQRSLDYYESQLGKGIITRLFYSPGLGAEVVGEFLSAQLGLNVAPFELAFLQLSNDESHPVVDPCVGAIAGALGPVADGGASAAS